MCLFFVYDFSISFNVFTNAWFCVRCKSQNSRIDPSIGSKERQNKNTMLSRMRLHAWNALIPLGSFYIRFFFNSHTKTVFHLFFIPLSAYYLRNIDVIGVHSIECVCVCVRMRSEWSHNVPVRCIATHENEKKNKTKCLALNRYCKCSAYKLARLQCICSSYLMETK